MVIASQRSLHTLHKVGEILPLGVDHHLLDECSLHKTCIEHTGELSNCLLSKLGELPIVVLTGQSTLVLELVQISIN